MSEMQMVDSAGTLEDLASEINAEHRAFVGTLRKTAEHGIRAGELLAEAKARCPHGTWLPWLEKNFEGAPRTAQEYMRLYNHRDAIRAKTQSSAHLSMSAALKELAVPSEEKVDEEAGDSKEALDVGLIRTLQERFLRFWSDEERGACERILADPGSLEGELLDDLTMCEIWLYAAQVEVDGFLFEEAAENEGELLISYRSPLGKPPGLKEEIVKVPVPIADPDEDLRECIKRGCWQLGLLELKGWRVIHNWFARALAADQQTDMEVWEKRVAHNADWRQLDPACSFLTEHTFNPETTIRRWVRENDLGLGEFQRNLELTEWLVGDYAERLWVYLTGEQSTRPERLERWKRFEVSRRVKE